MAKKRYYAELKKLAKRANQRMVELEKRGIKSPAYDAIQARLQAMGKSKGSKAGRRFSETGKFTYTEMQTNKKLLRQFLDYKTSTVTGVKEYRKQVWETANEKFRLSEAGITQDEYMDIWENLPDKESDRVFGSTVIIDIVSSTLKKQREREEGLRDLYESGEIDEGEYEEFQENIYTVDELIKEIQGSKTVKDAYNTVGITYRDVKEVRALRNF